MNLDNDFLTIRPYTNPYFYNVYNIIPINTYLYDNIIRYVNNYDQLTNSQYYRIIEFLNEFN